MPSAWNMFVKKIYEEGHKKNANYSFKQALKDASKRKSEMGSMSSKMGKTMKKAKTMKRGKKGGKSRRHRK